MIARRNRIFLWVAPVVALSWLTLAFLDPNPDKGLSQVIGLGYYFGSLFAHTTIAAAWAAYGPGSALWRVPLSLVWVAMLGVAIWINITLMNGGPNDAAIVIGSCFLAQWVVLQLPLWGLRWGFRSRLVHFEDEPRSESSKLQFGIRQLLIVTTIVGIIFGIGRLLIGPLTRVFDAGEAPLFFFLAGSAVVFSLPLVLAALLRRGTVVGVLIALVLIGLGTMLESGLLQTLTGRQGGRPNGYDLLSINVFSASLVLIFATIVRLSGYALTRSTSV